MTSSLEKERNALPFTYVKSNRREPFDGSFYCKSGNVFCLRSKNNKTRIYRGIFLECSIDKCKFSPCCFQCYSEGYGCNYEHEGFVAPIIPLLLREIYPQQDESEPTGWFFCIICKKENEENCLQIMFDGKIKHLCIKNKIRTCKMCWNRVDSSITPMFKCVSPFCNFIEWEVCEKCDKFNDKHIHPRRDSVLYKIE